MTFPSGLSDSSKAKAGILSKSSKHATTITSHFGVTFHPLLKVAITCSILKDDRGCDLSLGNRYGAAVYAFLI